MNNTWTDGVVTVIFEAPEATVFEAPEPCALEELATRVYKKGPWPTQNPISMLSCACRKCVTGENYEANSRDKSSRRRVRRQATG